MCGQFCRVAFHCIIGGGCNHSAVAPTKLSIQSFTRFDKYFILTATKRIS